MSEDHEEELKIEPLDRIQRRVLGVLVEKAFATPESYPLTLNAIVTGCNQKSARDPVMDITVEQAETALDELKEKRLVECIFPATGRTERWRHVLKEAWDVDGKERAIICELLLRGPQTEGELRSRASRLQELVSLDEVNEILAQLASDGFVQRISPEGRKRGVMWMHGFYSAEELARMSQQLAEQIAQAGEDAPEAAAVASSARIAATASSDRLASLEETVLELKSKLADLTEAFDALSEKVERMTG